MAAARLPRLLAQTPISSKTLLIQFSRETGQRADCSCARWQMTGFCTSSAYTDDQKRAYCCMTCAAELGGGSGSGGGATTADAGPTTEEVITVSCSVQFRQSSLSLSLDREKGHRPSLAAIFLGVFAMLQLVTLQGSHCILTLTNGDVYKYPQGERRPTNVDPANGVFVSAPPAV